MKVKKPKKIDKGEEERDQLWVFGDLLYQAAEEGDIVLNKTIDEIIDWYIYDVDNLQDYIVECGYCEREINLLKEDCDSYTPYGGTGPEGLEPHEPIPLCNHCYKQRKKEWIKKFKDGYRYGEYGKSEAERQAAFECYLVWCSGIGTLGTENWEDPHKYISQERYNQLAKLPYFGYCNVCGAVKSGGYCSNWNCEKSFERQHKQ